MKLSAFYAEVSDNALAFLLFVVFLCPVAIESFSNARRYTLSVQGKNRCPDFLPSGSRRVVVLRSHLECAKICSTWSECLHYSYQRNNGSCTLYSMTPANLYPVQDCSFMLVSILTALYSM